MKRLLGNCTSSVIVLCLRSAVVLVWPQALELTATDESMCPVSSSGNQWALFEWCCSYTSLLSGWFSSHGQRAYRLGLPDVDLRDAHQVRKVVFAIKRELREGRKVLVWSLLPCTDWSRWQQINRAEARRRGEEKEFENKEEESRKLLANLLHVIKACSNQKVCSLASNGEPIAWAGRRSWSRSFRSTFRHEWCSTHVPWTLRTKEGCC
jgi:hypothetical protein